MTAYVQKVNKYREEHDRETLGRQEEFVQVEIDDAADKYKALLSACSAHSDKLTSVHDKHKAYTEAIAKATEWLLRVEGKTEEEVTKATATEPSEVQDNLANLKALKVDIVSQQRLIEGVQVAAMELEALIENLPEERDEMTDLMKELDTRYSQVAASVVEKTCCLETVMVQSQDIREAVGGLLSWVKETEKSLQHMNTISLNRENLEGQVRELKVLQSELETKLPGVQSVTESARLLMTTSPDKTLNKKVEDLNKRLDSVQGGSAAREEELDEVKVELDGFLSVCEVAQTFLGDLATSLEARDLAIADPTTFAAKVGALNEVALEKTDEFASVVGTGQALLERPKVVDAGSVKDKLEKLQSKWDEIDGLLKERRGQVDERQQKLSEYELLHAQVLEWETAMEEQLEQLGTASLDVASIQNFIDTVEMLVQEHEDFSSTVDKMTEQGSQYDEMVHGGGAGTLTRSPKRRSPRELSAVQTQVTEANRRYDMIGHRLMDKQNELEATRTNVETLVTDIHAVIEWIENQDAVSASDLPTSLQDTTKDLKTLQVTV
ncbi:PREDICTED: microtubule-actin cross-linking factor 1-like [Priapulus caudatus]|uniref:Microtubule-actin cross-linking factor 1-like n=1 Tax=Priapulus caudatus TaxID=37621 RepID=A0ABM1E7B5_PRICU|nr:PREDICTED: microtubule-actin cross-linking factor 1-like [Priapulus caudatus]